MNKQVIFVAGTAYSGSTLLDMILANDPDGFSCGEVSALAYPFRFHHAAPQCGCGEPACAIWPPLRGCTTVHETLFSRLPGTRFLVDSSKSIAWIHYRSKRLRRLGFRTDTVLIWKHPDEYFASRRKRHQTEGWAGSWIKYHERLLSLAPPSAVIPYSALINDPEALRRLCDVLQLPYQPDKCDYWNKTHHTLFGNASAKLHLYPQRSERFQVLAAELQARNDPEVPRYRALHAPAAPDSTAFTTPRQRSRIERVLDALRALSDCAGGSDAAPRPSPQDWALLRLYRGRELARSLRYRWHA